MFLKTAPIVRSLACSYTLGSEGVNQFTMLRDAIMYKRGNGATYYPHPILT